MIRYTDANRRLLWRVGAAIALVAVLAVPAYASDGPRRDAGVATAAQTVEGDETSSTSTTSTSLDDTTTSSTAGDPTTSTSAPPDDSTTPDDGSTTTTAPTDAGAPDATASGMPGEHGEVSDEFPEDWTPEQVAFAEKLIADTEAALERYRNPGILPLLGYTWILDGRARDAYQHWVNLGWFGDGHVLDPDFPESLVFRNSADGPVLEAAMYMLPWGYDLSNIPEDIAWLPGWHVHDNLCFDGNGRIVDIAEDGVCERGFLVVTPPMIHVWIVDTPCGRFAGVDENGLICDHEH